MSNKINKKIKISYEDSEIIEVVATRYESYSCPNKKCPSHDLPKNFKLFPYHSSQILVHYNFCPMCGKLIEWRD